MPEAIVSKYGLEVREAGPKRQQVMGEQLPERVLLALQLFGFEPSGLGEANSWNEPGPSFGIQGRRLKLPRVTGDMQCSAAQLERAVALAAKIPAEAFSNPHRKLSLALHRFYQGAVDESTADAIIDFAISLETVLLQGATTTESTLRFRLNGAWYLSPHDANRRRVMSAELGEIYKTRSTIVHGGKLPAPSALMNTAKMARSLAAEILLKVLDDGWPDASDLEAAVLA
jgi:hypothetical protein